MVNHAGVEIPYPNQTERGKYTTSCVVPGNIVTSLRGRVKFRSREHTQLPNDVRKDIKWQKGQEAEEDFSASVGRLSLTERRHLYRKINMGECMSIAPSTVNVTEIGAQYGGITYSFDTE